MSAQVTCQLMQAQAGIETVLHFCCRDRNILGIQSELLGAHAVGVRNLICITGDPPRMGTYPDATAVFDASGLCIFSSFAWTLADIQPQIQAACEGDWSMEKLNLMGERIWNMERQFNLKAGLTAKDDTLPPRLLKEAAKTGPAKGKVNELGKMLPEYYEIRGWTKDGVPTPETVKRLGL